MAYTKTVWKDRTVEKPRNYTMTDNGDGTITLTPSPGVVTEAGTPIIAANLNNMEDGIAANDSSLADKASITLENMISPTLINSWANDTSGNYDGAKYYKDTLGIVHIQGRITGGTMAQDAFALPSGYRPAKDQVFVLGSNIVLVKAAGGFNIVSGTSPFNLNGINFRAGA